MKRAMFVAIVALVLIACVSISTTWHSQYKTQALTGSFNVTEPPPTPTPTPPPSPTVTPTRTPNSDDGSADKPEPGLELTINMVGKTTEWMQNTEGMILENIAASSRDGRIAFYISIGTIILGPDAKPLSHIFTGVVDPFTKSPPSDLPDKCYFVNIYEFLPEGARFSKPVKSFNPELLTIFRNPPIVSRFSNPERLVSEPFDWMATYIPTEFNPSNPVRLERA